MLLCCYAAMLKYCCAAVLPHLADVWWNGFAPKTHVPAVTVVEVHAQPMLLRCCAAVLPHLADVWWNGFAANTHAPAVNVVAVLCEREPAHYHSLLRRNHCTAT
jgi:hypothetical protein